MDNYPYIKLRRNNFDPRWFIPAIALIILLVCLVVARAETASWYSVESCRQEGTSGIMANGRRLNDEDLICASWDYPFGTRLLVTNLSNRKRIVVTVADRGPAKRLYRKGRTIDLSKKAFSLLAPLSQGVIPIKVEVING